MVNNKMFIPKTITVGYNERKDTYTGKLAYVIYTDDKGKLRKETSWQNWRQDKLGRDDFDNVPTSGFVLNKGVGGARRSYGWNARNEYIRVYDPRNFEFEISVANLLFILQECSSIKGKGLEGEFVYSWSGTELVLLPADCPEYKECVEHTARQKIKFDKKDMKEGHSYLMKDGTKVLYLGRHNYNEHSRCYYSKDPTYHPLGKKHIFLRLEKKQYDSKYVIETGFTKIAECISESNPEFADEYDKFKKSAYYGNIKKVSVQKINVNNNLGNVLDSLKYSKVLIKENDDKFYLAEIGRSYYCGYSYRRNYEQEYTIRKSKTFKPELKNNAIKLPSISRNADTISSSDLAAKDLYTLYVVTERGKKLRVNP